MESRYYICIADVEASPPEAINTDVQYFRGERYLPLSTFERAMAMVGEYFGVSITIVDRDRSDEFRAVLETERVEEVL